MTTYQDPPLQSRRAVRQGERADSTAAPFTPPQTPRTAAGAGEPLSYVTQNRPPLPGYDSAPLRGRRSSAPEPQTTADQTTPDQPAAPAEAGSQADAGSLAVPEPTAHSFRLRDFSPEARTAPPAWAPDYDRDNGVLDHHTQARPPAAAAAPQHVGSLAESLASEPNEQTLTRRELRAIRETHGISAAPTGATPVIEQSTDHPAPIAQAAPPAPAPSTQLDSAIAEFDALAGRTPNAEPTESETPQRVGRRAAPPADVAPEDGLSAFDSILDVPAAAPPAQAQQFEPVPQPQPVQQQPVQPQPVQPQLQPIQPQSVQHQPVQPPPMQQQPVVFPPEPAPMQPAQFVPAAPVETEVSPTTGERPMGHWTNQSALDDRTQVNEATISRSVGTGGAITTSALVLPQIPGHNMSTGEVMLTDSISLPSALAATGAHSPIDESDIDHLLDPGDHQMVNTDSVPIRAIRAVSSHTGSRNQIITTTNPTHGNRALTALIVSASGMVVVVVTLLVVALATEVI